MGHRHIYLSTYTMSSATKTCTMCKTEQSVDLFKAVKSDKLVANCTSCRAVKNERRKLARVTKKAGMGIKSPTIEKVSVEQSPDDLQADTEALLVIVGEVARRDGVVLDSLRDIVNEIDAELDALEKK